MKEMNNDDLKIEVISHRLSAREGEITLYDNIDLKFRYCDKEVSVYGLSGSYARGLFLFGGDSIDKMVKVVTENFEVPITYLGSIWSQSGKVMKEVIELSVK